ncbi:glycosyltransferase 87 family protein [Kribbella solani]|uniref:Alpha-1,2-mannosyltransferase n=1 Tax=Kribbella solani TaxID=236067 RepID=A0A841DLU6_9ACTN|nr:glycosyltransferase 87 family protein [Kribbella solani]MBB5977407.1 alpha-1,2-mannosyltransferase [Kribbella solani]
MTTRAPLGLPRITRPRTVALGICVIAGIALVLAMPHGFLDLRVYRLGGATLLQHPGELYDVHLPGIGLPFTYPPFAAVMVAPFSIVPAPVAAATWSVLSLICLFVIWRHSARLTPWALLGVTAASAFLEPVRQTLGFGQINLILCAVILADLLGRKHKTRGLWTGLAAGVKLTPLIFIALLLVTRQWKAALYASAGFAGTVVLGFLISPSATAHYWVSLVNDTKHIGGIGYASNQSWNGILTRLAGNPDGGGPVWMVLVLATAVAALAFARLLWLRDQPLAAVSICGLAGLFCSPISWSHHWVWIIPFGVVLLAAVPSRARIPVGVGWYGLFVLGPIWWPPNTGDREFDWTFGQQLLGNAYLIAALVAVVVLGVQYARSTARSDRRQEAMSS